MSDPARLLLVEDNDADVFLVRTALEECGLTYELQVCSDGEQALRLVARIRDGQVPCPDLLLLDLNLPKYGGAESAADAPERGRLGVPGHDSHVVGFTQRQGGGSGIWGKALLSKTSRPGRIHGTGADRPRAVAQRTSSCTGFEVMPSAETTRSSSPRARRVESITTLIWSSPGNSGWAPAY